MEVGTEALRYDWTAPLNPGTNPAPATPYTANNNSEPRGNVTFKGTLTKVGTNRLAPVATPYTGGGEGQWAVEFRNPTGQTEIVRQAGELFFHNLVIADNTKTVTGSDFNIRNYLYVGNGANFDCLGGTLTFDGLELMTIENVSSTTFTANNIIVAGRVTTPSSWNLRGNLTVLEFAQWDGTTTPAVDAVTGWNEFRQTAGTISITNDQPRGIQDRIGGRITFNKLFISNEATILVEPFQIDMGSSTVFAAASGLYPTPPTSMVTTPNIATVTSFEIKNYGANGNMASGIEVAPLGRFQQNPVGTVFFSTDGKVVNLTDNNSKWIINSGVDTNLRFGNVFITGGGANNVVRTESSFHILGEQPLPEPFVDNANFFVAGAGAGFDATAGTVSFSSIGSSSLISSLSPARAQFASLRSANLLTLNLNAGDEIWVSGNLIADNASRFVFGSDTRTAKVVLNGLTAPQYLMGTTTVTGPAFTFSSFEINKGEYLGGRYAENPYANPNGVVYMQKPVTLLAAATGDPGLFTITNGVLNLGTDTIRVASRTITFNNGSAIDGANGTYIIETNHQTPKLEDAFFTVGKDGADPLPTLWNLVVNENHQATMNLTVNNNMHLNRIFTLAQSNTAGIIEPKLLTIWGNLTRTNIGFLQAGANDMTMSRLVLKGTGTVQPGLSNAFFATNDPCGGQAFSITVGRQESLADNLTMRTSNLTIATGVNTLNLNGKTLVLADESAPIDANPRGVTLVSGSITADRNSTINFNRLPVIPANLFTRSEVGTIMLDACDVETRGDLIVNTRLITPITCNAVGGRPTGQPQGFRFYTGDNTLTFSQGMVQQPVLVGTPTTGYIIGNLIQTVTNAAEVTYPIGNWSSYNPTFIRYQGQGIAQQIKATVKDVDPVAGRGGDAKASVNAYWDIEPIGTPVLANALIRFNWGVEGVTPASNLRQGRVFAANWDNGRWIDYRNTINQYSANAIAPALNAFPVNGSAGLSGIWAVFAASSELDQDKLAAIDATNNKIVFTSIEPIPVVRGRSFKITMALQNEYGQPITSPVPLPVFINFHNGAIELAGAVANPANPTGVLSIPATFQAGRSETEITLTIPDITSAETLSAPFKNTSPVAQLIAAVSNQITDRWTPAISDYFSVLPTVPAGQPEDITFSRITYVSATATWKYPSGWAEQNNVIVIAKADTLLTPDEYPKNGVTYIPNVVYGAGSNIGNATVLYNGPSQAAGRSQGIDIAGLLPNTKYYVYVFGYSGARGQENYKTNSVRRNPNDFTTLSGTHDDLTLGGKLFSNELFATSSTIGTNATFSGTIYPVGDVDQFNFMVTSAAPNVRVLLTEVAGDYTVELYDFTGRRIRRSTLNGLSDEALVANNLPAGTYVVKIFAVDGSSWQRPGNEYKLLINTFSSEIFSVTPVK